MCQTADKYKTLEEVTDALHQSGLESSNLIIGNRRDRPLAVVEPSPRSMRVMHLLKLIRLLLRCGRVKRTSLIGVDFTRSNLESGRRTFQGQSLHQLFQDGRLNPYQEVIHAIGETLRT